MLSKDIVFTLSNHLDTVLHIDREHLPSKFWSNALPFFKYINEVKNEVGSGESSVVYIKKDILEEKTPNLNSFSSGYYFFTGGKKVNLNIHVIYPTVEDSQFTLSYYLEVPGQPADEKLTIGGISFKAYYSVQPIQNNSVSDSSAIALHFVLDMCDVKRSAGRC